MTVAGAAPGAAQENGRADVWRWVTFTAASGLPSDRVTALAVSTGGVVWVGTRAGVAWFDGYAWRTPGGSAPVGDVTSLEADGPTGVIAVIDSVVFRGDTAGLRAVPLTVGGKRLATVSAAPLGDGVAVLLSSRLYLCAAGACERPTTASRGPTGDIGAIGVTRAGELWAATREGIEIRSASGLWRTRYVLRMPEASAVAYAGASGGDELLAIADPRTGSNVLSASGGGPWRLAAPLTPMVPQTVDVGPHGLAAVSFTSLDLLLRDGRTWRWLHAPAAVGAIHAARFGAAGDLWVGGDGGLFLFRSASHLWTYRQYPAGDPRNTVNVIMQRRDGSVWLGVGRGILRLDRDGGETWTAEAAGLSLPSVTALAEDDSGNVWIGSGAAAIGVLRWDGRGWRRFGAAEGLGATNIHRIVRDRRGRLWFLGLGAGWPGMTATTAGPGAYLLSEGRFTRWGVPEGLSGGRVYAFAEGPDSALWFGTLGGIDRFRGGTWRHWSLADGLRGSRVFTLAVDAGGDVWFGHQNPGTSLGHIDAAGRISYLTERDGLPSAAIGEVRVAPDGAVWATTPSGLARCTGGQCTGFQMDDGLPSLQLWPLLVTATKVFVGTMGTGLATLDLAEARRYAARVTHLVVRAEGGGAATVEWQASSRLGWPAPTGVETRVRVDSGAWSRWSTSRSMRFEGVGPGPHRATVQARNWLGDPSGLAEAAFDIQRPLLRRPLVLGLLLGVALLLGGIAWLLVDQRRRSRAERRSADALRRRLASAMEQASDGFAVLDRGGVVEFANPAFQAITGWRAELIGRSVEQLAVAGGHAGLLPEVAEAIRRGEAWEGEGARERPDGTTCRCFERLTPLRDSAGEVTNLVWLVRDVTREAELEEQALQVGRLEAVGQLSSGIAHDFNNLLAVVLANASLLEPEIRDGEPETRRSLEDIVAAAQRGAELVSSLLAFGRRRRLVIRPVDVAKLLEGLRAPIRRMLPDLVGIEIEVADGLPAVRVDEAAMRQIMLSLASNARDAMPHGGVLRISATLAEARERAGGGAPGTPALASVRITVTDTGTGMDAATLARAFEPFFTTKPPGAGTGLGLSSVYGLVHQQRGEVELESTLGEGTSIRLVLPADPAEAPAASRPPDAAAARPVRAGTILLVEDTAPMRRAAQLVLTRLGFKVLVAADGAEGLAAFRANADAIVLVVTDIVMPRLDGIGLFDAIRAEGARVPFVFMSGYPASEVASGRTLDPSIPFLKKPWTADALAVCVRQALADGQQPPLPFELV